MTDKAVIKKTFINAQKTLINEFLAEMETEEYETMAQVRGALYTNLFSLEALEDE